MNEMQKLLLDCRVFIREVHEFRQDPEEELSSMPFGVIDYYGMEDLMERLDKAITASGEDEDE